MSFPLDKIQIDDANSYELIEGEYEGGESNIKAIVVANENG